MQPSGRTRTKALWSGAVTVAVLAVVLIIAGLFGPLRSRPSGSGSTAVSNPQVVAGQTLYRQALQAQESGDSTRAAELAQSALEADPNNAEAKALLEKLRQASQNPDSTPTDGSNTSTPGVDPDAAFLKEYKDLASLLPTRQAGFSFDFPVQVRRDISISGNPDPAVASINQIAWWVHDLKTRSAAKAFVTKTSRVSFPKDAAAVSVRGTTTYFGTDGMRFATIAFARGRYAFEVLVTVNDVAPKTAKTVASQAAAAFPESPTQ